MAKIAAGTENQVVGKVFILNGTVKAVSPDGTVRVLAPNSPIYANERIITESDGSVSIQFDGPPVTQMDLGRMTEVLVDQDVYAGVTPEVVSEAAAEAEQVQQSLLAGDQPIELEATAAGGTTGAGGGHPVFNIALDGGEVTPESGADSTGITTTTVGTTGGVFVTAAAAPEPTLAAPVSIGAQNVVIANVREYDKQGHDRDGYHKDGHDKHGRDRDGYDKDGYDKDGYGRDGHHRDTGHDREGNDRDNGYKDGYKDGYDQDGRDENGYDKFGHDKDGHDRHGYDKDGDDDSSTSISATASLGSDIGTGAQISGVGVNVVVVPKTGDSHVDITESNFVKGIAANGDPLYVTSDGDRLVYIEDGKGGLMAIKADEGDNHTWHLDYHDGKPTGDVVFTLTLNPETDTYTVTMLGSIDAYTVTEKLTTGELAAYNSEFSTTDTDTHTTQGHYEHHDHDYNTTVTAVTVETTHADSVTTETSYDVTLVFAVNAADEGPAQTVFHVTVDANNDGQLTAVSSEEAIGVTTTTVDTETTTVTTTTTSYAPEDINDDPPIGNRVDGPSSQVDHDSSTSTGTTEIPTDALQAALNDAAATVGTATFTNSDVIVGSEGGDTLTGSTGADTFVVGEGHDTILDYNLGAGDKVIIDVKYNHLSVDQDGTDARLLIQVDGEHPSDAPITIGSVTFEGIDFADAGSVEALKMLVDVEDGTTTT